MKGEQFCNPGGRQVPRPSQVAAMFSLLPVQYGVAHTVPTGASAQPPTPSHAPVWPQPSPLTVQTWCGSATPTSVGQQTPGLEGRLHETQAPVQALLQQTPSAQKLDWHSSALLQGAPSRRLPQLPVASQAWPEAHWFAELQAS